MVCHDYSPVVIDRTVVNRTATCLRASFMNGSGRDSTSNTLFRVAIIGLNPYGTHMRLINRLASDCLDIDQGACILVDIRVRQIRSFSRP